MTVSRRAGPIVTVSMRFVPRQPGRRGPAFPIRLWFACPQVNQLAGGTWEKDTTIPPRLRPAGLHQRNVCSSRVRIQSSGVT